MVWGALVEEFELHLYTSFCYFLWMLRISERIQYFMYKERLWMGLLYFWNVSGMNFVESQNNLSHSLTFTKTPKFDSVSSISGAILISWASLPSWGFNHSSSHLTISKIGSSTTTSDTSDTPRTSPKEIPQTQPQLAIPSFLLLLHGFHLINHLFPFHLLILPRLNGFRSTIVASFVSASSWECTA